MKGSWLGNVGQGQKMQKCPHAHSGSNEVQDICNLGVPGWFVHRRDNNNGDSLGGGALWTSMYSTGLEQLDPSHWVL